MQWLRANAARREFESFVADSTGPLLRTAFLMARDLAEAEDLVQETFLRVARNWPRVCAMSHPAAYARRVLVNLVIDGAERRSRRTGELDGRLRALDQSDGRAERDLAAVDVHEELLTALAALPARQRAVIVLRYWEDLPEAEVAAILGCSGPVAPPTSPRPPPTGYGARTTGRRGTAGRAARPRSGWRPSGWRSR